jgi:hypothetical protein
VLIEGLQHHWVYTPLAGADKQLDPDQQALGEIVSLNQDLVLTSFERLQLTDVQLQSETLSCWFCLKELCQLVIVLVLLNELPEFFCKALQLHHIIISKGAYLCSSDQIR